MSAIVCFGPPKNPPLATLLTFEPAIEFKVLYSKPWISFSASYGKQINENFEMYFDKLFKTLS